MDVEQTLCIIPECSVWLATARSSAQGHKAKDWQVESKPPIWEGRIRVVAKGEVCRIILEDKNTGKIFATCVATDEKGIDNVEPVLDSSRYYAMRIQDEESGRTANIGVGFSDRSFSFDFKAALQDHKRIVKQERELRENPPAALPALNLGFKGNETISVQLPGTKPSSSTPGNFSNTNDDDDFGFLPPPPSSKSTPQSKPTKLSGYDGGDNSLLGSLLSGVNSAPAPSSTPSFQPTTATTTAVNSQSILALFGTGTGAVNQPPQSQFQSLSPSQSQPQSSVDWGDFSTPNW